MMKHTGFLVVIGFVLLAAVSIILVMQVKPSNSLEAFFIKHSADSQISEAYRFALENPQGVLSQVKCYCGCLQQGHRNNRDCFVREDGNFDLMGLNCGLCVKTALVSKQMLAEGKTVGEIVAYVDDRWGHN